MDKHYARSTTERGVMDNYPNATLDARIGLLRAEYQRSQIQRENTAASYGRYHEFTRVAAARCWGLRYALEILTGENQ